MTARAHIVETLAGISEDNRPTPERQEKSQFTAYNHIWKMRTIAERLHGSERISSEEFEAAKTWTIAYILLYDGPHAIGHNGYQSDIRHDRISWAMTQAQRADSVAAIKEFIGREHHNLLVLSLYDAYSANAIAKIVGGSYANSSLCKYIDLECIQAYKKLAIFYRRSLRGRVKSDKD